MSGSEMIYRRDSNLWKLIGKKSQMALIQIGFPQGAVLGPLLYLIYVNDICNSCQGNILSFADDTLCCILICNCFVMMILTKWRKLHGRIRK